MKKWVLVVTEQFDPTADGLIGTLHRRRVPFLRWNVDRFPLESTVTLHLGDGEVRGTIRTDGRSVDLRQIHGVWHRSLKPALFPEGLCPEELRFARTEAQVGLNGLAQVARWRWI